MEEKKNKKYNCIGNYKRTELQQTFHPLGAVLKYGKFSLKEKKIYIYIKLILSDLLSNKYRIT